MKRIGIITLNGYINYGNRLQNYALQEVLKSLNFSVDTIRVKNENSKSTKINANTILNFKKKMVLRFKNYFINKKYKKNKNKRIENFKNFSNIYISETKYYFGDKIGFNEELQKYDYFITGSDQVWNPNYNFSSSIFFLTFTEKHKRIAYAPSFGVSEIKPEYVKNYKEWISGIHKLSVREDDGAKIIRELTGRNAPVLVDPTLLLTKDKWLSIAKEASNKPKGKYLLTYFLGGIPNKYKNQIKNIVKENKLEVINLGDIREKETYRTGPSEFIDYINDCCIFCTDSFHGAVFSILLEKPFIVFKRIGSASMYSRIDTLLNKFELNDRKFENMSWGEDVFDIDFLHIPPILTAERKKSMDYLKDALNIKEEK